MIPVVYQSNPNERLPPGTVEFHFNFVDWTQAHNRISVGFTIISQCEDDRFTVKLAIPGDAEDAAVNQLGELAGGPAWHRVQRVIGTQAPEGSRLERGVLHNVMPNASIVVEMDPRGLAPQAPVTIVPIVYKIVDAETP